MPKKALVMKNPTNLSNPKEKSFCRGILTFCNAIAFERPTQSSGKYLIAPFGDHKNGNHIQRIDKAAALNLRNNLNTLWHSVKTRFSNPCPVLYLHPDEEDLKIIPNTADKTPYGKVISLEVLADGIWANIKWLDGFEELPKRLQFSPRWNAVEVGDKIASPTRLISLGLTAHPNITTTSFANEADLSKQSTKETSMNKEILSLLGFAETDTPTDEAIIAKIKEILANQKNLEGEVQKEKERGDTAETALANEQTRYNELETSFKAERQARSELIIANAIRNGKVTEAQRENAIRILANSDDFEAEAKKIDDSASVIKTEPKTDGIEKGEKAKERSQQQARQKFSELVADKTKSGIQYSEAWETVKRENEELYKTAYPQE